ncbi:MAG TPA: galactosyltransferase-related protein [Microlunatus sp.]
MRTVIITIAHGRHDHLERQRRMIARSSVAVDDHVVVAMDDPVLVERLGASSETSVIAVPADRRGLPLATARNVGARAALTLGAELLIFLDVDCLPGADLVAGYRDAGHDPATAASLLCGPVAYLPPPGSDGYDLARLGQFAPHPGRPAPERGVRQTHGDPRLFWSLSFALTPATWRRIGGFDEEFVGYGAEDTDFGFRAEAAGIGLTWVGGATAYHQWHPTQSPPVRHLDDILRNGRIFARRWGWWPMEGWLEAFEARGLIHWDETMETYVRTAADLDDDRTLSWHR